MMILVSLVISPEFVTKLNIIDLIKMLPGVIIQSIGFYCLISATKYGKIAITSSIQKTKVVVTFLLGIIILKENCTILQVVVSIILVVLSIMVAKNKENDIKIDKKLQRKAILYSYAFVLFNGTSNFINKLYVVEFQNALYVVFNYAIIILIGIMIYTIITRQWHNIDFRKIDAKKYFFLQSALDVTSSIFNRFAMLEGNVSIISVIETSSIVVTILASRMILKEEITWKKYLMIIGIFLCVLLLALFKI